MDKSSGSSDSRDKTVGCGSDIGTPPITLNITTTTGGSFSVLVDVQNSVENLKKIVAQKLKVAKDRICLLHRERELQDGNLKDNGLVDGSKIILIPNVETGLLAQRPENTVMQALESLNDSQVNDFLSGKTPLNLSMRLGDHMMLIQLQLSTVNPSSPSHGSSRSRSTQRNSRSSSATSGNSCTPSLSSTQTQTSSRKIEIDAHNRHNCSIGTDSSSRLSSSISTDGSSSSSNNSTTQGGELNSFLSKHDFESLQNIVKSLSIAQPSTSSCTSDETRNTSCCPTTLNTSYNDSLLEQSPIKSLSNLVSSPIKTTPLKNIPISNHFAAEATSSSNSERTPSCADPISAKLTSCLCKRLDNNSKNCEINQCQSRHEVPSYVSSDIPERAMATSTPNVKISSSSLLHKTANNPIGRSKHRHYHTSSSNVLRKNVAGPEKVRVHNEVGVPSTSTVSDNNSSDSICDIEEPVSSISATDSRALAEASRNLTQTLRKLSKEVFTNKVDLSEEAPRKSGSGAVIESMKNHGKGIYSGTFSGTLNPALQDRYGRPKRDISTVIHILNDLLSATPQYSRGARISFEPPTKSSSKQSALKHQSMTSAPPDSCAKCLSSSKSGTCVYGECGGHYTGLIPAGAASSVPHLETCHRTGECPITSCGCHDISAVGNATILDNSSAELSTTDNRNSCTCSFRGSSADSGSSAPRSICSKCSIEIENNKTKCKLDQLRLVMQQRKQRREARKMKGAPYGARVVSTTSNSSSGSTPASSAAATASTIAPLASPSEVSPNHIVEEVDTAA